MNVNFIREDIRDNKNSTVIGQHYSDVAKQLIYINNKTAQIMSQ